jgi:hypothetical protein
LFLHFFFAVSRTLFMLSKCFTIELHPQLSFISDMRN